MPPFKENKKPLVLVVEDEPDMRQNLAELLSDEFTVLTAENGEKALRTYYSEQFSLSAVLLDIRLPDMNGIEILTKMREINLEPDIIMLTALSDVKTAVAAMQEGAYDYITKPFFAGDLVATIKRALEKKDYNRKLSDLTDRLERERLVFEHRQLLFQELQMKGKVEGRDINADEKTLFHFPVLTEEDYSYKKLKEKLEKDVKTGIEPINGASILIAVGSVDIRDALKNILAPAYKLEDASSGKEVFERLREQSFELVILDVRLPDVSGLDVLTKIKQEHPFSDVIFVTGFDDFSSAVSAIKQGAYDYIVYPFIGEDLLLSIKRVMEKRSSHQILQRLIEKYKEIYLSFDYRAGLFKQLFAKRKAEKRRISMDDFYTFFPEQKRGEEGEMVDFPDFANETELEDFLRKHKK
ncbi:hypothetical protein A2276_08500 [candidate division WOR-1 bacterium RIFOXYA12_FULL_43_27]|uniref:Response regulatory domain-containing protein n=1 Tax=candidate division WOR-1 bacterium RIFOXYC2_FULL_46_14 TaxID=1802587 RepID=A0A1F4U6C1_UNCSA|nr:MAG: hypothetical protein A2276_08500 [candidate division WOR-1 bacterium RIFOXYA12_FULL_43_27]OGC20631.1 MAG: hypothetical protein A2292_06325 [candidate division WOR-1 bacterium RIFOXYB2_FULL_46_45]OGC31632.1 MAG: hypothetical protein A2232_05125 [candidate division WOR-1 bacterium RIFOXYA2_FULL_46_56]OGC40472.1 MAG: hypothetical protein A2438_04355 [candidate division WOR-1 bacterium RIFOXYC2_FULL_46_14]